MDLLFASIIATYSNRYKTSLEESTDLFYNSRIMKLIENKVADLHCRSAIYLADELRLELFGKLASYI